MKSRPSSARGFSAVELMTVVAVIIVITAVGLPSIMRSIRTYQLAARAADVDGILKRTRFEAVKANTIVNCLIQPQGNNWLLGADLNNNGVIDPTEPQVLVTPPFVLLGNGVAPSPGSMGYGQVQNATLAGAIAFDPRGIVNFGAGPQVVYLLYVGNPNQTSAGFRTVAVLPMGSTKIWGTGGSKGPWHAQTF